MRIVDLAENAPEIEQVAELLVDGFCDTGSGSWRNIEEARDEVQASLRQGHISRIAVDALNHVLGWISGIEGYSGNVWELHPLVVRRDFRRQGVGRTLVADFERQVAERGGQTVWLGTDDENTRTSLGGVDVYPNVLDKLRSIKNIREHPFEFYLKAGYQVVGLIPDANGFGKPDILMAKRVSPNSNFASHAVGTDR